MAEMNDTTNEMPAPERGGKRLFGFIFTTVLIDLLLFAICLLSFCYFHHVRKMWADTPDNDDGGGIIIGGPDETHDLDAEDDETAPPHAQKDPPETGGVTDADETKDADVTAPTETEPPETDPPETEPPEPKHKFEDLFAPEGVVEATDTYYKSHDIYMTLTEHVESFGDYVAKYFVYDVYVRYTENLYTVYDDTRHYVDDYIKAGDPVAAISGDYWDRNAKIAVRGGVTLRRKTSGENDFCVMYYDGTVEVHPASDIKNFEITDDVYQIWNFGPSLLDENGKAKTDFGAKNDIKSRNPRSSMGYYEPGHYCFIIVEGRCNITYEGKTVYSKGMRFVDLSALYERLGCKCAYNFDGGDSAYAYYNGEMIREDYDNAHDDDKSPRRIYDIICIGELNRG